ncbi:MAG: hypothetical protein M1571_00585 [Firmicutes bacterium]|nr:hypothetical protein [Bacillota bacterium]
MKASGASKKGLDAIQVADVEPGRCDPYLGCPPPTEVVCIVTEKVYDECKKIEVNEDEFCYITKPDCPIKDVICLCAELLCEPECEVPSPGRVRVTFSYKVTIRLFFETKPFVDLSKVVTVIKNFHIPRAGEDGLHVQCYVPFIECLDAFIRAEELDNNDGSENENSPEIKTIIIACVGKYILIKVKAKVQLLIPAYGFCPEPPDCDEVLGLCPDFRPEWPPFPLQTR